MDLYITVEELRRKRETLQTTIGKVLAKFTTDTGLPIADVEIKPVYSTTKREIPCEYRVKVNIKLG